MLIRVDPLLPQPLFEQLAAAVRGSIVRGEIVAGERLPGARELAASLGVNVHTVLHGYQELRDQGLVELRRGRGAVVTNTVVPEEADLRAAIAAVHKVARKLGLDGKDLATMIREGY
ncbi:GntR family transcriptional regulator [Williamsia sp. 1138]|uniref:GntR family transcriptional regulator n=1 Tax=Williamsia sp. 1138 TaxID=1903117 RepID=UPI000A11CDD5|nr:GntR family transcriptional regulator [Williamsia sp. 1138]OZG27284.1 GntR family transcriptional regulator [Williamsia sp. 1138]